MKVEDAGEMEAENAAEVELPVEDRKDRDSTDVDTTLELEETVEDDARLDVAPTELGLEKDPFAGRATDLTTESEDALVTDRDACDGDCDGTAAPWVLPRRSATCSASRTVLDNGGSMSSHWSSTTDERAGRGHALHAMANLCTPRRLTAARRESGWKPSSMVG